MVDWNQNQKPLFGDWMQNQQTPYGVAALNFGNIDPTQISQAQAGNILGTGGSLDQSVFGEQFQQGMQFGQNMPGATPPGGGFFKGALGKGGWGTGLLGAAQAGAGMYFGSKQMKLAEEALKTQKGQFTQQYADQKQQINRDIYEQGQAKYARNPSRSLTPEAYYEKHKIG